MLWYKLIATSFYNFISKKPGMSSNKAWSSTEDLCRITFMTFLALTCADATGCIVTSTYPTQLKINGFVFVKKSFGNLIFRLKDGVRQLSRIGTPGRLRQDKVIE